MEQQAWRILIVEDDQRLAELTREYLLGQGGFEVGIETDGARAVERIVAEQPDLVVLDVMLPGEDGMAICRRARERYDGPILM
ncbi:MAG: response regulator, partial [Pseudomonadota bacterium]